jgi:hypothetical protein
VWPAAVAGAAGEMMALEVAGVASTSVCVCKVCLSWASVRQRHNSSIDSASDSATTSEDGVPVD